MEYTEDSMVYRGEVYLINTKGLTEDSIHVMKKNRPAIVIQSDKGNKESGTIVVAFLTGQEKKYYPMHYIFLLNNIQQTILFEQTITIDKNRLIKKLGMLTPNQMNSANIPLMSELGLTKYDITTLRGFSISKQVTENLNGTDVIYTALLYYAREMIPLKITLDKIMEFNKSITITTPISEITNLLDTMSGTVWLYNQLVNTVR